MADGRGRPVGHPKTGGSRKGSVKTNTQQVKDTIKAVFYDDLGGAKYLRKIAKEDPALFTSLLAKLLPQEIRSEISVNHTINLADMMRQAEEHCAKMINALSETPLDNPVVLDHIPAPVAVNGSQDV